MSHSILARSNESPADPSGAAVLSATAALPLGGASGHELIALLAEAASVRDAAWGRVITYSRKVFVPLTNMCRDSCGYCAFVKAPGSPEAQVMPPEAVLAVARDGARMGCKEVLFSLGEKPELRYREARDALRILGYRSMTDYLAAMCALVLAETGLIPHVNTGTLSDAEIVALRPVCGSMGMMVESVSERLLRKGQAHHACPDKVPARRLLTLERAGRRSVPFTTGILIGIGETWDERVQTLSAISEVHTRHGHIQEVIVQNFRAKPGTAMAAHPEPTLEDMVRTIAVARLMLAPSISVQAPPNLQSHYADYIDAGLNDWGGISPVTIDHINPERAWPKIEELKAATRARGYELRERLTVYPSFLCIEDGFLDTNIAPVIRRHASDDGLAASQWH